MLWTFDILSFFVIFKVLLSLCFSIVTIVVHQTSLRYTSCQTRFEVTYAYAYGCACLQYRNFAPGPGLLKHVTKLHNVTVYYMTSRVHKICSCLFPVRSCGTTNLKNCIMAPACARIFSIGDITPLTLPNTDGAPPVVILHEAH